MLAENSSFNDNSNDSQFGISSPSQEQQTDTILFPTSQVNGATDYQPLTSAQINSYEVTSLIFDEGNNQQTALNQDALTGGEINSQLVGMTSLTNDFLLGRTLTGTIAEPGERQVFTFSGTTGQRLIFDGLATSNNSIRASLLSPTNVELFDIVVNADSQPITFTETGTYSIVLDPSGENTGSYSFRLLDVGAIASQNSITLGQTKSHTFDNGKEIDLYSISGSAGQRLLLDSATNVSTSGTWILYGSDNAVIASIGVNQDFQTLLPSTGDYVLAVIGNTNNGTPYTFTVNNVVNDAPVVLPPANSIPLTLGNSVESLLVTPGEQKVYTFQGSIGQKLVFDSLFNSVSGINVRLVSPTQNVIFNQSANNDYQSFNGLIPIILSEQGSYQLIFSSTNQAVGDYKFRLLDLAVHTESLQFNTTNPITGTLSLGVTAKIYRFSGTTGQELFFDQINISNSSVRWSVYGSSQKVLTYSDYLTDFRLVIPETGDYWLILDGSPASDINYSFRVSTITTTTQDLIIGNVVEGKLLTPAEQQIYTFTGSIGQQLVFDSLFNSPSGINVRLVSPSQNTIFNQSVRNDLMPIILSEQGIYQLIISSGSQTVGDYKFQLLDLAVNTEPLQFNTANPITGTLNSRLTRKIYRFSGNAGQQIFFDYLNSSNSNVNWRVYGSSQRVLADADSFA
ncbi:hypothetical protein, partial [Anabaena sp. 4-3]|uniref:hypothetical protein n=1 Tax=Anabaena sp. 4-3 TaxID=1811979 RepID=UPI0018D45C83